MKNYYEKLEVTTSATAEEIKKAYRLLSKKYHPDMHVGGNKHAEEVFKEIKEAYEVLSNPSKKAYYDYQLELIKQYGSKSMITRTSSFASTPYQTSKSKARYNNKRKGKRRVVIDNSQRGAKGILPVFIGGFLVIGLLIFFIYKADLRRQARRAALPNLQNDRILKYNFVQDHDYVDGFKGGLSWVLDHNKFGVIDTTGQMLIKAIYDWHGYFREGIAAVKRNGKYGFINNQGKEITPIKYDMVENFAEGRAFVMQGRRYSLINQHGKEIARLKYDYIDAFKNGLAKCFLNGKWGFIDIHGNEVIKLIYHDVYLFNVGLAAVQWHNGYSYKWGFIDKKGKVIIPCIYDEVKSFGQSGITEVTYKNTPQAINMKGECIEGCF